MDVTKPYFEPEDIPYREVGFGLNDFQEPKVLNFLESIEQIFYNIFVMRPGNLPSQPHIGVYIKKYLYKFSDELDTNEIRDEIFRNCIDLFTLLEYNDILITPMDFKGENLLLIVIPLRVDETQVNMFLSFQKSERDHILYRFKAALDDTQVIK